MEELARLTALQSQILAEAERFVRPGGTLAYATCSVLRAESGDRIAAFLLEFPRWTRVEAMKWLPGPGGDGFHVTILHKPD